MAEVRLGEALFKRVSGAERSASTAMSPYLSLIGLSLRASIFSSMCFCFDASRNDLFGCLLILPERSFELAKERLPNMMDEERDRNE